MFVFGNLFVRNLINKTTIGLCMRYHMTAQTMQGIVRSTAVSHVKTSYFNNTLNFSPVCLKFVMKPANAMREPDNKSISQILENTFPSLHIPAHIGILDTPSVVQIEEPSNNFYEKQAARLVVIRRRKMKKHKLKKLRKKMKFEWAKLRQRRELKKEKKFQAELIAQMKEAEKFDASEYVSEKLKKAQYYSELKEDPRRIGIPHARKTRYV